MPTLTVATEVQKAVFERVLLDEITAGFWQNVRPVDHAARWNNIRVEVGTDLGARDFKVPRNYNFVNPRFFGQAETKLLEAARTVDPSITVKQLKKQLIALNQIIGGRLREVGGTITKLPRGGTRQSTTPAMTVTQTTTVRKAVANIVELEPTALG